MNQSNTLRAFFLSSMPAKSAFSFLLTLAICLPATAGTRTVDFGWEDGTSTVLGEFIAGASTASVAYSNVTMGSEFEYGAVVTYEVTPSGGSRMLEIDVTVDESDSDAVQPYLGHVQNLDHGDTVQFSFKAYDPTDGSSPSVLSTGVYGMNGDVASFAGFFTPFQCFDAGDGWLDVETNGLNVDCSDPNALFDPNVVFDEGVMDPPDREAVTLQARPFRPSASTPMNGGSGNYKFFIDDLRISVTSENPDASITLPDGSVTLVNSTTSIAGDYDGSGQVAAGDLNLVLNNWGQDGTTPPVGWVNDFPNGIISAEELNGVLNAWGNSAVASVPEPSSFALLLFGLLAFRRRR